MACKLNLKAPNGADSKLFKDIVEASSTHNDAIDTYFYTKTPEFADNYEGATDENGEPVYADIRKGKYTHDVDYARVELDTAAEVFKSVMDTVPQIEDQIERRIEYLQYKGDSEHIPHLQELLTILQTEAVNSSIPKFFESASKHVGGLYKGAKEMFGEKVNTKEALLKFSGLAKTASSYEVVTDLKAMLLESSEVASLFEEDFAKLDNTVGKIADIQEFYVAKSREFLVDEFHKGDPTWSKKDIMKTLKNSPQDVTWLEYQLMHMGDSKDRLLYEASKRLREADHTARRASIDFAKELQGKLEAVEKAHKGPIETMFESILVEHNNELHVVDPTVTDKNTSELEQKMLQKLNKAKGNSAMMDFLVYYSDTMKTLEAGLPNSSRIGTRVPSVLRSELELLQGKGLKEKQELLMDHVKNKVKASNLDMEKGQLLDATGKPVRRIPTFYNQAYNSIDYKEVYDGLYKELIESGKTDQDAKDEAHMLAEDYAKGKLKDKVSKDLAGSLQAFHAMATKFSAKYDQVHVFDAIEAVVGSKQRSYNIVEGGKVQIDARTGKPQTREGQESMAFKQLMKIYDMQLYGQKQADLGNINILGTEVDANKALRGMTSATSMLQIPFNLTAAGANITYGEYSNLLEAAGGEYFKFENLKKASKFYAKHIPDLLADFGARTPSSILNLMEEHYDLLQNYGGNKISNAERTSARRLLKTSSMYFLTSSAEHLLQVRLGLAVMDNTKTFTKDGVAIGSLLDAHSVKDGKLSIRDDIYVKEKDGSLVKFDEKQQNRIGDKIGGISRKAHGNYSPATAGAAKQHALGNMFLQFRGWMAESVNKRYARKAPNHLLEQDVEGFYRTGGRALVNFAKDVKKFNLAVAKENWKNLTPAEKANIRRFMVESSMMAITAAASIMLGKMGKEIEDEYDTDSWEDRLALGSFRYAQYQVLRFRTEVSAYANLNEALKLLKSPAATVSLGESLYDFVTQLAQPLEQYESGWRKGDYKLNVRLQKLVPIYKHISTIDPDALHEKAKWLTN